MGGLYGKQNWCIIGFIIGIVISAFAVYGLYDTPSAYTDMEISKDMRFGGDFYSEQYDATKKVQVDISRSTNTINKTMIRIYRLITIFIMLFGFAVQSYFGVKYYDCKVQINREKNTSAGSTNNKASTGVQTSTQMQKKPANPIETGQWKCPECGKMNPNISIICKSCNYKR